MSETGDKFGKRSVPEQDKGINLQKITDICDVIIDKCWVEIVQKEKYKTMSIQQLQIILGTVSKAWQLASDAQINNVDNYIEQIQKSNYIQYILDQENMNDDEDGEYEEDQSDDNK